MMASQRKIEKVAVVGSGIGGLAFAACMKSLDCDVKEVIVYDAYDDLAASDAGGALVISGGAAILERIGCLDELKADGQLVETIKFTYQDKCVLQLDLQSLSSELSSRLISSDAGKPMVYSTRWSALRKILSNHAFDSEETSGKESQSQKKESKSSPEQHPANISQGNGKKKHKKKKKAQRDEQSSYQDNKRTQLVESDQETNYSEHEFEPHVSVQTGKHFQRLTEDSSTGKVTLYFEDQTVEGGFDLVIGADGVKSRVRQFTQCPNETLFGMLQSFLHRHSTGGPSHRYTGVRVIQCLTPPIENLNQEETDQNEQSQSRQSKDNQMSMIYDKLKGDIHQWCGRNCNLLTVVIGDEGCQRILLAAIYPESREMHGNYGDNVHWAPEDFFYERVKTLLLQSGFNEDHMLHSILNESRKQGGVVFDIGVQNQTIPLRSWASNSGRIILLGDSAHTMTPFLGQGANQAIQDAFCLASLIGKYNRMESLSLRHLFQLQEDWFPRYPVLNFLSNRILERFFWLFNRISVVQTKKPTRLQTMVYEYESIRKFPVALISLCGGILASLLSLRGHIGVFCKIIFFRFLHITGLGRLLLLTPMRPIV